MPEISLMGVTNSVRPASELKQMQRRSVLYMYIKKQTNSGGYITKQ